jgi:hypothetical protein
MVRVTLLLLMLAPAGAAWAQCDGVTVVQEGPLLLVDHDASYNCAVDALEHQSALVADTLRVRELAVCEAWADCYCPYRSNLALTGLAPGQYVLDYVYGEALPGEEPPAGWSRCLLGFTVIDPAGAGDELAMAVSATGCGLSGSGVPGGAGPGRPMTWEAVRALFH